MFAPQREGAHKPSAVVKQHPPDESRRSVHYSGPVAVEAAKAAAPLNAPVITGLAYENDMKCSASPLTISKRVAFVDKRSSTSGPEVTASSDLALGAPLAPWPEAPQRKKRVRRVS